MAATRLIDQPASKAAAGALRRSRGIGPCVLLSAFVSIHCGDEVDGGPASARVDAGVLDLSPDGGTSTPDAGSGDAGGMDGGTEFVPPAIGEWVQYEPEGATCADGSPYKFFVNFSGVSDAVVFYFEGGGACWDYRSCTGGARSARNLDGVPDGYADALESFEGSTFSADFVFPLLSDDPEVSPMYTWNRVFFPYCTGDTFAGSRITTYEDPGSGPPLELHHTGHQNILAALDLLQPMFGGTPQMLVSGCSAGGTGSLVNYHFLRSRLDPDRSILVSDSGPLFPTEPMGGWSGPLHARVQQTWGTENLVAGLPGSMEVDADFGAVSAVLANTYPEDRLATTVFRMDYDFSLFSYERFWELLPGGRIELFGDGSGLGMEGIDARTPEGRAAIYDLWWDDLDLLRAQYDAFDNLSYFMPFYRNTQNSHCLTLPGVEEFSRAEVINLILSDPGRLAWAGTELDVEGAPFNMRDYLELLLDDRAPLESFFETTPEGPFAPCSPDPAAFDPEACRAAVEND